MSAPHVPVFSVSPLDLDQIAEIIPLGNLNPSGGHVLPTDHVYLDYNGKAGLRVRAPGDGEVYAVRDQLHGGSKIEVRVDACRTYYVAHVTPDAQVRSGIRVKAGQVLGQVTGESLLDLGAADSRQRRGFVNPRRYPESTLHAISPLALFTEPLRGQLRAKIRREAADKDGKFDFDQPGRLVGNWFHESQSVSPSPGGQPAGWARLLAFAYDVREPQRVRVSIGGTVAPAGLYAVQVGAPDPATIGIGSGSVKYELVGIRSRSPAAAAAGGATPAQGTLLVELVDDETLRVEWFAGIGAVAVGRFTEAASRYRR